MTFIRKSQFLHVHIFNLLLCIIFLSSIRTSHATTPKLLFAEYGIKEADLFGVHYKYAIFEAQYDQDLYHVNDWTCPCVSDTQPCPLLLSTVSYPIDESSLNLTVLRPDTWTAGSTSRPSDSVYYKLEVPVQSSVPCPVLTVEIENQIGTISLFMSAGRLPTANNYQWFHPYNSRESFSLCPFNDMFTYGTYYIGMLNQIGQSLNAWRIRFTVTNSPTCPATRTPPPTNAINWIPDGAPIKTIMAPFTSQFFKYYYEVNDTTLEEGKEHCFPFAASVNAMNIRSNIDLYASTNSSNPTRAGDFEYSSAFDGDDRLSLVLCTTQRNVTIYLGIYNKGSTTTHVLLTATTSPARNLVKISSLSYTQAATTLSFGVTPRLECDKQTFTCLAPPTPFCDLDDSSCCYLFLPLPATEEPSPLEPWNAQDTSLTVHELIPWNDVTPLIPGKLAWSLYLGRSSPTSGEEFVFSDPGSCRVVMGSSLASVDGDLVREPIIFKQKTPACSDSKFANKIAEITNTINTMYSISDFYVLALQHLRLNILSMSDDILGCSYLIDSLLVKENSFREFRSSTACFQVSGTPQWGADPCCNATLSLSMCCAPRVSRVADPATVVKGANESSTAGECLNSECANRAIETYASSSNSINDLQTGCSRQFIEAASLAEKARIEHIPSQCRDDLLGMDLMGSYCRTDGNCLTGRTCDPYTLRCQHTVDDVIDCIVEELPPTILRSYLNRVNRTHANASFADVAEVIKEADFTDQCIGPGAIAFRSAYQYRSLEASCVDPCSGNEPICFDTECTVPVACNTSVTPSACHRYWAFVGANNTACLLRKDCNWRSCPADSTDSQCEALCVGGSLSADTCVDCSTGTRCLEVAGFDENRCSQGLCTLGPTADVSTCTNSGICDVTCATCNSQPGCRSYGICSDMAAWGTYPKNGTDGILGVCLEPLIYHVDGVACNGTNIKVPGGCINTTILDENGCAMNSTGGRWARLARTQAECLAHGYGCATIKQNIQMPRSLEECEACPTTNPFRFYTWKSGQWTSGRVQPLKWVPREFTNALSVGSTLDYSLFAADMQNAIADTFSFAFITEALCRYTTTYTISESLVCDCSGTGNGGCFNSIDNQQVGAGTGCAGIASITNTRVASVEVFINSYPEYSVCQLVALYTTSASEYELDSSHSLSSAIFQSSPTNSFWVVQRTGSPAAIGQIVSGAVNITLGTVPLDAPVRICVHIESTIEQAAVATIWSLATLNGGTVVAFPPSTTVNYTGESVCDFISQAGVYFATKLVENYQQEQAESRSIRDQSRAGAVFYFCTALFAVVQCIILASRFKTEKLVRLKLAFVAIVFVNCMVRGIYLVVPASSFDGLEAIQFIIFELPSFLFFSVYLSIIFLWVDVVLKTSQWGKRKGFMGDAEAVVRNGFFLANIIMYLIFIIFMFLISILPSLEKPSACFLGAQNDGLRNSSFYRVKLAYWIIVATICCIVSVGFIIGASFLLKLVLGVEKTGVNKHNQGSARSRRMNKLILISVVAGICTIFLLIRSALFLYASITSKPINVIVFVLLEVIPSLGLLYYLRPYWFSRMFRSSAGSSTGASRTKSETLSSIVFSDLKGSTFSQAWGQRLN